MSFYIFDTYIDIVLSHNKKKWGNVVFGKPNIENDYSNLKAQSR